MLERDLTRLSSRVREAAIVNPNGEVRWAADIALEAINELADTGSVILGLDIWPDEEGEITESAPQCVPRRRDGSGHRARTHSRDQGVAAGAGLRMEQLPHSRHLGRSHLTSAPFVRGHAGCRVHPLLMAFAGSLWQARFR